MLESAWDFGAFGGDYHDHLKQFSGVWKHKDYETVTINITKILLNTYGDKQFYFTYQDHLGAEFVISLKDLYEKFTLVQKFHIE